MTPQVLTSALVHSPSLRATRAALALSCGLVANLAIAQTTVSADAQVLVRTTTYTYFPTTGKVETEVVEPTGVQALKLSTRFDYDPFGNEKERTPTGWNGEASESRPSYTRWDTSGRFPESTTNAKGHQQTRDYDARFNQPTRLSDPNLVTTRWEYDGLGRKKKELRGYVDAAATAYTDYTEWTYENCTDVAGGCASVSGILPVYVVTTVVKSNQGDLKLAPTTRVYFDRLNRELRTESEGFDSGVLKAIYKDTVYDANGNVWKESLPYFAGATPSWNVYEYDDLGRRRFATAPNSVRTEYLYSGTTTSVTVHATEGDRTRVTKTDGAGNVVEIVDPSGRSTRFFNDAHGNRSHTIDPYGNTVQVTYDVRGRKLTSADPDMGPATYVHNAFGELYQRTDAKQQTVTQKFDDLGRLSRRTEPDLTSDFVYDTETNGKGKLARAYTNFGYCRSVSYDTLGRQKTTTIRLGGDNPCFAPSNGTFVTALGYDAAGRLETTTYPTQLVIKNTFNPTLGFLETVADYTAQQTGTVYWRWQESDAHGRTTRFLLGNNISTLKVYDGQTNWLRSIYSGTNNNPSLGDVLYAGYDYDSTGNLRERSDRFQLPNLVEKTEHDELNRLKSYALYNNAGTAEITGSRVSLTYDAIGNIKTKSDTGTYYYNPSGGNSVRPHAVTEVRGKVNASYVYADANGNMTSGANRTFTYTSYNMVAAVGNWSTCQRFWHQSEHLRVEQRIHSGSCASASEGNLLARTFYLHPDGTNGLAFEVETKGGTSNYKHYIAAGDVVVGMVVTNTGTVTNNATGTVSYFHYDHLGSVVAVSNAGQAVVERRSFDAWGRPRQLDGQAGSGELPGGLNAATDRGFTLHEHLEGLGLVHMNGRVYDFTIGRFVSPDPFIQDPADLQSHNRFAYVQNRPLSLTDPSGFIGLADPWSFDFGPPMTSSFWGQPVSLSMGTGSLGNGVTFSTFSRGSIDRSYNSFTGLDMTMALSQSAQQTGRLDFGNGIAPKDQFGHEQAAYQRFNGCRNAECWKASALELRGLIVQFRRGGAQPTELAGLQAHLAVASSMAGDSKQALNAVGAAGIAILASEAGGAKGPSIALGLGRVGGNANALGAFSKQVGGLNYHQWESAGLGRWDGPFEPFFNQATSKAGTIHFNLDGIDLVAARNAPIDFSMRNNVTNSELRTILNSPSLMEKTIFYRGGQVVAAPR